MKYKLTILILCIGIFASSQIIEWNPDTKHTKMISKGKYLTTQATMQGQPIILVMKFFQIQYGQEE